MIIAILIILAILLILINVELETFIKYFVFSKLKVKHLGNYDVMFYNQFTDSFIYSIYGETLQIGLTIKSISEWDDYFNTCEDSIYNILLRKDYSKSKKLLNKLIL